MAQAVFIFDPIKAKIVSDQRWRENSTQLNDIIIFKMNKRRHNKQEDALL